MSERQCTRVSQCSIS